MRLVEKEAVPVPLGTMQDNLQEVQGRVRLEGQAVLVARPAVRLETRSNTGEDRLRHGHNRLLPPTLRSQPMPTKKRDTTNYFMPVILYLDDLKRIVSIVEGIPGVDKCTLETDHYFYETIDELSQYEEKESKTMFLYACEDQKSKSTISVGVSTRAVYVSAEILNVEVQDAVSQISEIIKESHYTHRAVRFAQIFSPLACTTLILGIFFLLKGQTPWVRLSLSAVVMIGLSLSLYLLLPELIQRYGSRIIFSDRPPKQKFWENNKEKVIVEVIKATVAAFVGAGLALLIQKIR